MDYFALLNFTPSFQLDPQTLETAYFTQQRLYHPDRFVGKSPAERQQALLRSADINAAYETLKNPLTRAQYLLHLQGIEVGTESDTVKPSQALLMETLEWRETIDEATGDLTQLDDLLSKEAMKTSDAINEYFQAADWQAMAHATLRLGYIIKAREAVAMRHPKVPPPVGGRLGGGRNGTLSPESPHPSPLPKREGAL